MCVIDLIIRMSSAKLMETVAAAVSLTGAMFWFIGSCFLFTKKVSNPTSQAFDGILDEFEEMDMDESFLNLFKNTLNEGFYEPTHAQAWSALWIVGSLCNLYTFVYDLYIIIQEKERAKPLFKTSAVAMGIMANVFFLGGPSGYISHTNAKANGLGHSCTVYNSAGVLIAASIFYFIYGILIICESKMGNLRIAIVISKDDNE